MKKYLSLFLIILLLISGCSGKDHAKFYYSRLEFQYHSPDSVIVSEYRDITGHANDLSFLISLYLMGPLEKDYVSLFPSGVRLLDVELAEKHLTIELSEIETLSDAEYSLACACMALTCLELTDAQDVTITSGSRSVTIDPNQLTIYDSGTPIETTTGGQQ